MTHIETKKKKHKFYFWDILRTKENITTETLNLPKLVNILRCGDSESSLSSINRLGCRQSLSFRNFKPFRDVFPPPTIKMSDSTPSAPSAPLQENTVVNMPKSKARVISTKVLRLHRPGKRAGTFSKVINCHVVVVL